MRGWGDGCGDPRLQTVMLPLLSFAADGKEHRLRDAIEELADHFDLTEDERKELLPSGRQATFDNRVGWARRCRRWLTGRGYTTPHGRVNRRREGQSLHARGQ
jgi:restriction endonuclease Mrr